MKDLKKLDKCTNYPIYFLDENASFNEQHIISLEEQVRMNPNIHKIRLLLNPSFHDAKQESIFIANEQAHFPEKKYPFLPWMECQLLSGEVSLIQQYPNGQETTFLNSHSNKLRFDPAVFHYYKVSSSIAIFKIKSIGPYLEKLVEKKMG